MNVLCNQLILLRSSYQRVQVEGFKVVLRATKVQEVDVPRNP